MIIVSDRSPDYPDITLVEWRRGYHALMNVWYYNGLPLFCSVYQQNRYGYMTQHRRLASDGVSALTSRRIDEIANDDHYDHKKLQLNDMHDFIIENTAAFIADEVDQAILKG